MKIETLRDLKVFANNLDESQLEHKLMLWNENGERLDLEMDIVTETLYWVSDFQDEGAAPASAFAGTDINKLKVAYAPGSVFALCSER